MHQGVYGAAAKGKRGLLELANHGTLFLDEIGDLPLSLQVKLLKVIEENRFIPVGGLELREVDIRIISATHHDLRKKVEEEVVPCRSLLSTERGAHSYSRASRARRRDLNAVGALPQALQRAL
jgi:transcriptional regulator with AAA-type ATPase domain